MLKKQENARKSKKKQRKYTMELKQGQHSVPLLWVVAFLGYLLLGIMAGLTILKPNWKR